jgi:uncharacterized integral membrane protein
MAGFILALIAVVFATLIEWGTGKELNELPTIVIILFPAITAILVAFVMNFFITDKMREEAEKAEDDKFWKSLSD